MQAQQRFANHREGARTDRQAGCGQRCADDLDRSRRRHLVGEQQRSDAAARDEQWTRQQEAVLLPRLHRVLGEIGNETARHGCVEVGEGEPRYRHEAPSTVQIGQGERVRDPRRRHRRRETERAQHSAPSSFRLHSSLHIAAPSLLHDRSIATQGRCGPRFSFRSRTRFAVCGRARQAMRESQHFARDSSARLGTRAEAAAQCEGSSQSGSGVGSSSRSRASGTRRAAARCRRLPRARGGSSSARRYRRDRRADSTAQRRRRSR